VTTKYDAIKRPPSGREGISEQNYRKVLGHIVDETRRLEAYIDDRTKGLEA
jgi:hypothetical protein